MEADAWATALMTLSYEDGLKILDKFKNIGAAWLLKTGKTTRVIAKKGDFRIIEPIFEMKQTQSDGISLSHLFGSFPHIEQLPSEDKPPHDPDKGFLLKITPIDIPVMASIKTKTPKNISMLKIKLILALFLWL